MKILPRLAIILIFVLAGSFFVHPISSINQDIGRHIKSGEIIWEMKSVYKTNLFSFTEPGHRFINHHWFSEVVFYAFNGIAGLKGLIILKTLVLLSALLLIYLAIRPISQTWAFLAAFMAGIFVFIERTDVRPEMFSYLFMAFFLFAIFRAKYLGQAKWLYALPVVQLFWSNMHIYFALGPILLLFFLIERIGDLKSRKGDQWSPTGLYWFKIFNLKKELWIFVAVIMATLINPNFIIGATYPLQILSGYGYSIVENQNIFFLRDYGLSLTRISLFQISLAVLIFSFVVAIRKKVIAVFETLSAVFFSIMAMLMLRNFAIYALAFIPIVAMNLSTPYEVAAPRRLRTGSTIFYSAVSIVLVLMIWNSATSDRFGLTIPTGGQGGIDFVRANELQGPVFNNFDVGSFLIWKLPREKVFVDGRPEAYSKEFFQNIYIPMQENPAMWARYSEEYGINYIFFDHRDLTPWAQAFLGHISENPEWEMTYLDDWVVIFEKNPNMPENVFLNP